MKHLILIFIILLANGFWLYAIMRKQRINKKIITEIINKGN